MEEKIITFEAEKVKLSSGFLKDFVVCTAYLMSDGVNRNDSEFTLESLQKSLPGFLDKPVLANILGLMIGKSLKTKMGKNISLTAMGRDQWALYQAKVAFQYKNIKDVILS